MRSIPSRWRCRGGRRWDRLWTRRARCTAWTSVILRLMVGEEHRLGAGGPVTYLAEVADDVDAPVRPWDRPRDADHPLRASWARPGGPADDLAWADAALDLAGMPRAGPGVQVRSWNLSSLWRLPTARGTAWLKVVPPFFAHEGALLTALDSDRVPEVLATDGARTLLAEVPGDDLYGVGGDAAPRDGRPARRPPDRLGGPRRRPARSRAPGLAARSPHLGPRRARRAMARPAGARCRGRSRPPGDRPARPLGRGRGLRRP